MGIKNYLIEGGSGTGKTSVAEELQRRGFDVVHGDRQLAYYGDAETGEPVEQRPYDDEADNVTWAYQHWIWPADEVKRLTTDQRHPVSFFCGHSANAHQFLALFDKTFLLNVDLDTLKQRLASRPEDEFGGRLVEQDLVTRLHKSGDGLPSNAIQIDATAPISRVVDDILARCGL